MTRDEIIIPDSAHGTNPASASMAGFSVVQIPSNPDGGIDIEALKAAIGPKTAAFMITNPNTLGVFEPKIREIASIVHSAGALLYYDGANFNAIVGITNPGKMGFDLVHFNLHKTFATPHGGGGPGAGPIAVNMKLRDYIPEPFVDKNTNGYFFNHDIPNTIG
ncbi:glycine dehydrogenase subunit 2, partial [mine drainage metagenome]